MQRFPIQRSILTLFGLSLALGTASCGDDACGEGQVLNEAGECVNQDGLCGDDCLGCRQDLDCCDFSINCQAGSICNDPSETLFDSTQETGICLKVICDTDADCDSPKRCSLQKICEAPVCQTDTDCGGGQACLGGECVAPPSASDAASCEIVTKSRAITEGGTLQLGAIAKNANGVVLARLGFTWSSSDPSIISIEGDIATGGASSGTSDLSASVTGNESVTCGPITVRNFPAVQQGEARVVVFSDITGDPIEGVEVTAVVGGAPLTAVQSGADGSATISGVGGPLESVTAWKDGFQGITVMSPGTTNVLLPLPQKIDTTKAGGFRGSVNLASTRKADIQLGIVAPSIPANLLDFELESLIGDFVPTVIDAPELGLNNEEVSLPGGVMLGLGQNKFTDDSGQEGGGLRCQGVAPGETELGCYAARAPEGLVSAWTLAGQLKLSSVTEIAGKLSSAFGGDSGEVPVGDILAAVLPLLQRLNHGVKSGLQIDHFPKVNVPNKTGDCSNPNLTSGMDGYDDLCQGDFTKYQKIDLAADHKLGVLSSVAVPKLPTMPDGGYAGAAILLSIAVPEAQGLVPLGLSAGIDIAKDTDTPDGVIAGATKPFGDNSQPLDDGNMPLAMAPPHSGLEDSQVALVSIALDLDSLGDQGIQLTGIVAYRDRVNETDSISSLNYLTFPEGTFTVASGTYALTKGADAATVIRLEVQRGGDTWLVYAPKGAQIVLPDVSGLKSRFLSEGVDVFVQGVKTPVDYADIWEFGSGTNLDRAIELIEGFVIQECDSAPGSVCLIQ